jgi:hypothetical protein
MPMSSEKRCRSRIATGGASSVGASTGRCSTRSASSSGVTYGTSVTKATGASGRVVAGSESTAESKTISCTTRRERVTQSGAPTALTRSPSGRRVWSLPVQPSGPLTTVATTVIDAAARAGESSCASHARTSASVGHASLGACHTRVVSAEADALAARIAALRDRTGSFTGALRSRRGRRSVRRGPRCSRSRRARGGSARWRARRRRVPPCRARRFRG